ncbi:MAG: DEAD/DEAH box helicase [Nanoarchaeota archaeon]
MEFLQNIQPREYQQKIFETCTEKNCLVVLPTGMGKTLVALMLSINRLQKFPEDKILFLAPTKPLAEQHLNYYKKHLPELFAEMNLFTGAIQPNKRKKLWEVSDIIFSTPQCIANDIKNNLYNLENVSLLVEDEAHRCLKNYDYNFVAQKYKEYAKNQRIIGMTASPGSEEKKIKEICKNLSIEEVELRTRESDDVKSYLQKLDFKKIMVEFPPEFSEIKNALKKIFDSYIDNLRERHMLFGFATKIELIKLQKKISFMLSRGNKNFGYFIGASACAQAIKLQHAMELLETQTLESFNNYMKNLFEQARKAQSKGVQKLIAMPEFNFAFASSIELLAKNVEHPKVHEILELISREILENKKAKILVFTQFRDTASIISRKLNDKNITAEIFVGQAKKTTNGKSTGLNQKEQKKIIERFSEGEINVLCATSIGEEGLDIPEVNAVIFYEPVPSAIRAIQRAGRTARLFEGKLMILVTRKTRDEGAYYASRSREKKMHSSIDSVNKELKDKNNKEEKQKTSEEF